MKILKYIMLLLLLVFIASSIFVATLKPDYNIVRSRTIKESNIAVYNYVNDYKNWAEFGSWKQDDPKMKFIFPKNTIGKGSYYSWNGQDGNGKIKTVFVKENDSIHQKMTYNDAISDVYWSFKKTKSGTVVTWTNVGKMNFVTKIFTTLLGGMDKIVGSTYDRSLKNIELDLKKVVSKHTIIANGFIETTMGLNLQKTINSKNENIDSNIRIMIINLMNYIKNNKIITVGKPFVQYNNSNNLKGTTIISVGVQLKDSIKINPTSEYKFNNMLPFQAIKVTLEGDLIYKNEAEKKALELIIENNLIQKNEKPTIEVFKISKFEDKNSNNWITEIYIPVKKKEFAKKHVPPTAPSRSINSNVIPTTTSQKVEPPIEKIIIKKDFPQ